MRGRRRITNPQPFGLSVLDVMTNAFGAVLLLFVIKQIAVSQGSDVMIGQAETIRKTAAMEAFHAEPKEIEIAKTRFEQALVGGKAEGGDGLFGVAPVSGRLVLVLDVSGSISRSKAEAITSLGSDLVMRSRNLSDVYVIFFTDKEEYQPFQFLIVDDAARQRVVDKLYSVYSQPSAGGTRIIPALGQAIALAAQNPGGGAVVLFSDGIAQDEVGLGTTELVQQIRERTRARLQGDALDRYNQVVVHTVSVSDAKPFQAGQPLGARFGADSNSRVVALGRAMQRIAEAHRGTHISAVQPGETR